MKTDLVNCYYRDQDDKWEKPAKVLERAAVHELKRQNLGKFENHGRTFRLFQLSPPALRPVSPFFRITKPASVGSTCAISFAEMQANLGIVDDGVRDQRGVVEMAREKIVWYPHIFDEQAALAHGAWDHSY